MWPWSTIAKLRADLAEAQVDADRYSKIAGTLSTENEQYRQRWTALNESYETVHAELLRAKLEISGLRMALNEAAKNDYRDPVTKRFAKRPEARS